MNLDQARIFLTSLPHAIEAEQFGGLIYWLGDNAIGGKMFAMLNIEASDRYRLSFPAGAERFAELIEQDGLAPAPYLARVFWVAAERWDVLRHPEWEAELRASHALTHAKLSPKTRQVLALPGAEQKKVIAARRKVLAAREAAKRHTTDKQDKERIKTD